jgi:hypothetical protein
MTQEQFNEKLPVVLEALKEAITNEIGNFYDFNFNDYDDLVEKEFRPDILDIFMEYARAISLLENDFYQPEDKSGLYQTIATAMGDYDQGYAWTEEDDENDFQFDETPFKTNDEMNEFIGMLENYEKEN